MESVVPRLELLCTARDFATTKAPIKLGKVAGGRMDHYERHDLRLEQLAGRHHVSRAEVVRSLGSSAQKCATPDLPGNKSSRLEIGECIPHGRPCHAEFVCKS